MATDNNYVESKPEDFKLGNTAKVSLSNDTLKSVQAQYDAMSESPVQPLGGRLGELEDYIRSHYKPTDEFTIDEIADSGLYASLGASYKRITSANIYLNKLTSKGILRVRRVVVARPGGGATRRNYYGIGDGTIPERHRNALPKKTIEKREKLKAFILKRSYGKGLGAVEVARVLGMSPAGASQLLKRMVEDGELFEHEISPFRKYYVVASSGEDPSPVKHTPVPDYSQPSEPAATGSEPVGGRDHQVLQYLASLPEETPTTYASIIEAGIAPDDKSVSNALYRLRRSGKIERRSANGGTWYKVIDAATVAQGEAPPAKTAPNTPPAAASASVKEKAMLYAWGNADDLPAVRRFIEWLEAA